MSKTGTSDVPNAVYEPGGQTTWQGPKHFTRAETRYGIFYMRPPSGWADKRNCFESVDEARVVAESRPSWLPVYVWDFVKQQKAYDFGGAA